VQNWLYEWRAGGVDPGEGPARVKYDTGPSTEQDSRDDVCKPTDNFVSLAGVVAHITAGDSTKAYHDQDDIPSKSRFRVKIRQPKHLHHVSEAQVARLVHVVPHRREF
jgi:hypothetical protein